MIESVGKGRTWVLSGPTSTYALNLTGDDELLHLHWGPRISGADAEALADRVLPPYWPFESQLDGHEEYPVEGGPRFVRPALSVRTPAVRGTEWRWAGSTTAGDELRLCFTAPVHHLGLTLHYPMRADSDVVERWGAVA